MDAGQQEPNTGINRPGDHDPQPGVNSVNKEEELAALHRVMRAFDYYEAAAEKIIRRWGRDYARLPADQKALLTHLPLKYSVVRRCVQENMRLISCMLQVSAPHYAAVVQAFEPLQPETEEALGTAGSSATRPAGEPPGPASGTAPPPPTLAAPGVSGHGEGAGLSAVGECAQLAGGPAPGGGEEPGNRDGSDRGQLQGPLVRSHEGSDRIHGEVQENGLSPQQSRELQGNGNEDHEGIRGDEGTATPGDVGPEGHGLGAVAGVRGGAADTVSLQDTRATHGEPHDLGSLPAAEPTHVHHGKPPPWSAAQAPPPAADSEKVLCMLRNIVRDWSAEGAVEREQTYAPILEELRRRFPRAATERPSCLVPGAGLARLACEVSRLGFVTQGNEFSYYCLLCSSFILNETQAEGEWPLFPWVLNSCNVLRDEDQLAGVRVPDLLPRAAGITDGFSMCAGDFLEVYNHPSQAGAFDCVVTCFFIDTANNVVEYIRTIAKILAPGGLWVNLGPLLYHFADPYAALGDAEMSVELSLEDVKRVAYHFGFRLLADTIVQTTYTANQRSMMRNLYDCAFWTMVNGGKGQEATADAEQNRKRGRPAWATDGTSMEV